MKSKMILLTVIFGFVLLPPATSFSGALYSALQKKNDALAQQLVTLKIQEAYQQDGVVRVANVLSQDWINRLQQACTLAEVQPGPHAEYLQAPTDTTAKYFTDLELSNRLEIYKEFSSRSPCAAIAGHVMGCTETRFFYDQLFLKPEGVSIPTPWHQDGSYWSVEGGHICSVFCALDEVKPEEGLWFVTDTHSWPLYNRRHFSNGTPYQESASDMPELPDIDALVDTNDQHAYFQFHLNPGDALVFNNRIVHGGPGNYGRALSTRWVGEGTAWATQGVVPTNRVGDAGAPLDQDDAFPLTWQRD